MLVKNTSLLTNNYRNGITSPKISSLVISILLSTPPVINKSILFSIVVFNMAIIYPACLGKLLSLAPFRIL